MIAKPVGLAVSSQTNMRNLRIRPVMVYGDGLSFPHSPTWEQTPNNGPAFDCDSLYASTQDFKYTGNPIYVSDVISVRVRQIGRSGFYPMTVTMPISGTFVNAEFENIMVNRAQNNPFEKKPPILMVDHSLDIGEDYINTGAVYEATGRETFPRPINEHRFEASRNQPPALIGFDNETTFISMMNGSGDNGKVNNMGTWTAVGVKNFKEDGGKLLTESSYPGAVCEFSGLGDPSSNTGNGGWPVQCNRSPSDPLEFYGDGIPPACNILLENDIKHIRFVGLNAPNSDRHKALFVGIKPTAFAGAVPSIVMSGDLIVGRMLNNEMLDVSAPFGASGYMIPFGNEFSNHMMMFDLPQKLGIVAPTFMQYPDIAIVPLGDPRTTTKHRVYWLSAIPAGGVYAYTISYIDLDNNGETVSSIAPTPINLNMNIHNEESSSTQYNIPLQFDIVQPEAGKFILVVTLGVAQLPAAIPEMEKIIACAMYSSSDGINFTTPIPITVGAFNNTQYPNPKGGTSEYQMSFGLPHLSHTAYGKDSGEILLCLTNLNCTTVNTTEHLSTFVL